jgi:hypothetical protein
MERKKKPKFPKPKDMGGELKTTNSDVIQGLLTETKQA